VPVAYGRDERLGERALVAEVELGVVLGDDQAAAS